MLWVNYTLNLAPLDWNSNLCIVALTLWPHTRKSTTLILNFLISKKRVTIYLLPLGISGERNKIIYVSKLIQVCEIWIRIFMQPLLYMVSHVLQELIRAFSRSSKLTWIKIIPIIILLPKKVLQGSLYLQDKNWTQTWPATHSSPGSWTFFQPYLHLPPVHILVSIHTQTLCTCCSCFLEGPPLFCSLRLPEGHQFCVTFSVTFRHGQDVTLCYLTIIF